MDIEIDYETVCVNCKTKGYNFGYSFKTIKYKGLTALDLPNRHLNGSAINFKYRNVPILMYCQENAHLNETEAERPVFSMINAKKGANQNNPISKFTYVYMPEYNPDFKKINLPPDRPSPKLIQYVDTYNYAKKPYILLFYSFRNQSKWPLQDFKFYQFYDFDIYGEEKYDNDRAQYDSDKQVTFQWDDGKGRDKSLIAGVGSVKDLPPSFYEVNTPQEILISEKRPDLRNIDTFGPGDGAVALQWDIPIINPGELVVFPIYIVFGNGQEAFDCNRNEAQAHLEKLLPTIYNAVNEKFRQMVDSKLEEMSFSVREWCKD